MLFDASRYAVKHRIDNDSLIFDMIDLDFDNLIFLDDIKYEIFKRFVNNIDSIYRIKLFKALGLNSDLFDEVTSSRMLGSATSAKVIPEESTFKQSLQKSQVSDRTAVEDVLM